MSKLYTLIMAGGKGTRFWPLSTEECPKQYIKLIGETSLLEKTFERLNGISSPEDNYVVTVESQKKLALEQSKSYLPSSNLIFEPSGRNTAPCIFLSLLSLIKSGAGEDDVVVVLPSDQVINNSDGFKSTVMKAQKLASTENAIVTIGITPDRPHTGYGYIHRGENRGDGFQVVSFKEKPDLETAKTYISSGEYFWNAGMFIAPIGVLLSEFAAYSSDIFQYKDELYEAIGNSSLVASTYQKLKEDSIDYAIMEKSENIIVVPAEFDWSDLGSWDAIQDVTNSDDNDNISLATKKLTEINSTGNIVYANGKRVSLIDVHDLVIVSEGEQLMILPKNSSQKVKEISKMNVD